MKIASEQVRVSLSSHQPLDENRLGMRARNCAKVSACLLSAALTLASAALIALGL